MKKTALLAVAALLAPTMLSTGVSAATSSNDTPVSANFTAPTNGGTNPTPPNPVTPDGGSTTTPSNKPLDPQGTFGIAYIPNAFNFGTTEINGSGELNVSTPTAQGKTFNVGVKNTTHTADGWTLNASLTGDLAQTYGAKIKTNTVANSVQINDGTNQMTNVPTGTITNTANYTIGSSATPIMTAANKVLSGTFDLSLGDSVTLSIPDASTLKADNYTGTVTWNLAQTPQP